MRLVGWVTGVNKLFQMLRFHFCAATLWGVRPGLKETNVPAFDNTTLSIHVANTINFPLNSSVEFR